MWKRQNFCVYIVRIVSWKRRYKFCWKMWLHRQRRGSDLFSWKERRDHDFFCWGQKMRKPFFRRKLMSWSWTLFSGVYLTSNRHCNSTKCTDYRVQCNGVVAVQLQTNCTPKRAVICTTSRLDIEKRWVDIWPSFSIYRVRVRVRNKNDKLRRHSRSHIHVPIKVINGA